MNDSKSNCQYPANLSGNVSQFQNNLRQQNIIEVKLSSPADHTPWLRQKFRNMKLSCVIITIMVTLTLIVICVMVKFASEIKVEETKRDFLEAGDVNTIKRRMGLVALKDESSLYEMGERFPYLAAIATNASETWVFRCFGSLILPNWVLTSARCKTPGHKHRVLILGELVENRTQTHPVQLWRVHEQYSNLSKPKYDIALVQLTFKVSIRTVAHGLLSQDSDVYASVWKTVMTSNAVMYLTNDIEVFHLKTADKYRCELCFGVVMDESLICVDTSMYDDCMTHEFGSLFQGAERLVGLLTIKSGGCQIKMTVFTKVSHYAKWINKTIHDKQPPTTKSSEKPTRLQYATTESTTTSVSPYTS